MALAKRLAALGAARKYAQSHSEQVHGAIDKVAGAVRGRAPQQHRGKVDSASDLLKKAVTGKPARGATHPRARTRHR
jgi:hypothetical protein